MKRGLFIILLLSLVAITINSCSDTARTLCGDGICDKTESCACSDCTNSDFCKTNNIAQNCNDNNECTIDSFNPAANTCIHEKKQNCCGNNICEGDERICDYTTFQTACTKDCGVACPAKLVIHKDPNVKVIDTYSYVCGSYNCLKTGDNKFNITGTTSIVTYISNIGEKTSDVISSNFICYDKYGLKVSVRDGDKYQGVVFTDKFNDNQDTTEINSKITGNNMAKYAFSLTFDNDAIAKYVKCSITVNSPAFLQSTQEIEFTIN